MASNWQPELKQAWSATCDGAVRAILLSPRGKVATVTSTSVFLFDGPPSFALRRELRGQPAGLTAAAFSSKGTDVVSGGADGFLKWWQVDSGDELCSTQFPMGDGQQGCQQGLELSIPEVACSKGGFVAAVSGRLLCIFGSGGEHLHTLDASGVDASGAGALQHVTWLDDSCVLGCCGSEATIWRVDAEQYEEVGAFGTNPAAAITQLAMSPNGKYLAAACENQTVQVWDTQQEGSMDPVLVISEGIDAPIACLSWDASSKLLAAAVGAVAMVWDVASASEGSVGTSYVCIGFEQGAKVSCLAFQPNGTLLAATADNGLCLVFDSAAFGASSVASGLVTHVAGGRLATGAMPAAEGGDATPAPAQAVEGEVSGEAPGEAEGEGTPEQGGDGGSGGSGSSSGPNDTGAIASLAWHSTGSLLVGTSTGLVGALQPLRAGLQRAASEAPTQADASAVRRQEPQQNAKRRSTPQPPQGSDSPPPAATKSGTPPAAARAGPAGWGGEPLATNGLGPSGSQDFADAPPMGGMGMRGRGGRGGRGGGRYGGPPMQPYGAPQYGKRDGMPGGGPGGTMKPGGPMGGQQQQQQGVMSPEQAQMMQAAAVAQWGMMPTAMAAPHMWRVGMGYAMSPYGQMMVPQMPGMAAAVPSYPAAMPGAAAPQVGAAPQPGRGAPYGARPGMGGPMGGRGGRGPPMGAPYNGSQGEGGGGGGGGGGRGPMGGGGPYARRGASATGTGGERAGDYRGDRPPRRDAASPQQQSEQDPQLQQPSSNQDPQQQYHHHHQQQQPQEQPSPVPSAGSQRPGHAGGRGGAAANSSGGGDHWHGDGGGQQQLTLAHAHGGPVPPPHAPPSPMQPQAVAAGPSAMMARPPYGMAPVYMFPQAGMMPWGMYPGQMAFPTPGGYMMYPAASAYGAAGAPQGMQQQGMAPGDGGDRKDGGQMGGPRGGGGLARHGSGAGSGHYSGGFAGEDGTEGGGYQRGGGGGYAAGGGYPASGGYGGPPQGPLTTLYVGNLANTVDEAALAAQFEQFGHVERAQVIRDRETHEAKGYGFVTFGSDNPQAAQAAMARLNGAVLQGPFGGRAVRVSPSNKWRGSGGDAGGGGAAAGGGAAGSAAQMASHAMAGGLGMGGR